MCDTKFDTITNVSSEKLKLGKEYKEIKLYFIKTLTDYVELEKIMKKKK